MGFIKNIELKLGAMRKPDSCVVYPETRQDGLTFVQGDRLVLLVDLSTGKGIANWNTGSNHPTSWHLVGNHPNNKKVTLTSEQIELVRSAIPKSGDCIGSSVCTLA